MNFQVGTALLDACLLALLSRTDAYGYALTQNLKDLINVSESALYPVLRRLQKDDCLSTYDQPFQGRNRRYYRITEVGEERLQAYLGEWDGYKKRVDKILLGGAGHESA